MGKIEKNINSHGSISGVILYQKQDDSINFVHDSVLESINKLRDFYKIPAPFFYLELVYSRKEFDKLIGRKTLDWFVGVSLKNRIILFSPSIVEKFSRHNKLSLKKIINHELCHLFNNQLNSNILNWVDEGIALFFSDQEKSMDISITNQDFFIENFAFKNIKYNSFCDHGGYMISYRVTRNIVDKFGIRKLLDLAMVKADREVEKNMTAIFCQLARQFLINSFQQ